MLWGTLGIAAGEILHQLEDIVARLTPWGHVDLASNGSGKAPGQYAEPDSGFGRKRSEPPYSLLNGNIHATQVDISKILLWTASNGVPLKDP